MSGKAPGFVAVRWFRVMVLGLVLFLETAAFILACRLADKPDFAEPAGDSMAAALLGDSRAAIGNVFYEEADLFFHRGVGHYRPRAFSDLFVKLGRDISPTSHIHLMETNVVEIVPWLYFATRVDSRNVTAYTVAAFWLAGEAQRPDLAERVLAEARRANPRDYRVYLDSGCLAIKLGNLGRAARLLEAALALWPGKEDPEDLQTKIDRANILEYRGLLSENESDLARAQALYRQALELVPTRAALKERLAYIQANGRSPSPPFEIWNSMLYRHAQVCDKETEEPPGGHEN